MRHIHRRDKLLKRAEAILADIEGGYELKRPEIARLIREMSVDIYAQSHLIMLTAVALGSDPRDVVGPMFAVLGKQVSGK